MNSPKSDVYAFAIILSEVQRNLQRERERETKRKKRASESEWERVLMMLLAHQWNHSVDRVLAKGRFYYPHMCADLHRWQICCKHRPTIHSLE